MKSKVASCFVSFLLIVVVASPCFGQKKANDYSMTLEQIKARVAEAHAKDKRLIVRLKTGGTISGNVMPTSGTNFMLTQTHGPSGGGATVSISYADVAEVRGRNAFLKALKTVGRASIVAVGVAAFLPVWAALEGLSYLLHGEGLPSCSTGN